MSRLYPTRDLPVVVVVVVVVVVEEGWGEGGGASRRQTNGRRKRPPRAHYLDLACQRDITSDDTAALFFIHSPECRWRNISESLRRCNTCSSCLSAFLSSVFLTFSSTFVFFIYQSNSNHLRIFFLNHPLLLFTILHIYIHTYIHTYIHIYTFHILPFYPYSLSVASILFQYLFFSFRFYFVCSSLRTVFSLFHSFSCFLSVQ